MTDELTLSGKRYISSKRAAKESGYTQDYIGQLARQGLVDAQRVGGSWYVLPESVLHYQKEGATAVKDMPVVESVHRSKGPNQFVAFDGKDYISASRASDLTGYNQDYVGQLARSGKVLARQVGSRWYVERSGILAHKEQKDALLAAVQAESVGLVKSGSPHSSDELVTRYGVATDMPVSVYSTDNMTDLVPVLKKEDMRQYQPVANLPLEAHSGELRESNTEFNSLQERAARIRYSQKKQKNGIDSKHGISIYKATLSATALTVVIVLSFGLSLFSGNQTYASKLFSGDGFESRTGSMSLPEQENMLGAVSVVSERIGSRLEGLLSKELVYKRVQQ